MSSNGRRCVGLVFFGLYALILAFGVWREEVRPSFLDGTHQLAMRFWNAIGIPPGLAVFSGEGQDQHALREHHLTVVPIHGDQLGEPIRWRANAGRRIALRYDPAEVVALRLLLQLDITERRLRAGPIRSVQANQRRLLRSLGKLFHSRLSKEERAGITGLVAAWEIDFLHHESGEIHRQHKALIQYRVPGFGAEVAWRPSAEQIAAAFAGRVP